MIRIFKVAICIAVTLMAVGCELDYDAIENTVDDSYKMIYIQRSRGYSLRPSLTIKEIEKICKIVRSKAKKPIIMLDNCYGEFVERLE